jgi:hypothetical protein
MMRDSFQADQTRRAMTKELIEEAEARARMPPFQYRELLSEREILQNKISATAEKTNQGSKPEEKQA